MKIKNSNMEHMHRQDLQFHEFFVKLFFKIAIYREKRSTTITDYIF